MEQGGGVSCVVWLLMVRIRFFKEHRWLWRFCDYQKSEFEIVLQIDQSESENVIFEFATL